MELYHGFKSQNNSLEYFMRTRLLKDFPEREIDEFKFWFITDRGGVEPIVLAESLDTALMNDAGWQRRLPGEDFVSSFLVSFMFVRY
jgi:hypothetical protein